MNTGMQTARPAAPSEREDPYPSRVGAGAGLVDRADPVVHARSPADGPIPRHLVERYERQGFLVLENVFSGAEVARLRRELDAMRESQRQAGSERCIAEPGDHTLRSIFAVHRTDPLFAQLARDRRLVDLARFLLADEVYIHQSRLNYKPGFRGKEFYWHSDFETWHVEDGMPRMRALSMSVTLTDNSPDNGPLMLIPGSHRHYVTCSGLTPEDHFKASLRRQEYGVPPDDLLRRLADEGGIVSVDAAPGSVIVFDCNTMHGSNGNITPYPRSNAFIVYNAVSNRVVEPYCGRAPRPEFICTRESFAPVTPRDGVLGGG